MKTVLEAIVLRKTKYSDSSFIVNTFTRELGVKAFIVSVGKSRANKTKKALLSPLSLIEITSNIKDNNQLSRATDIKPNYTPKTFGLDIEKTSVCLFLAEFLQKVIKQENADEDTFDFLSKTIIALDIKELNVSYFHLNFIIALTQYIGIAPKVECKNGVLCIEDGEYVLSAVSNKNYFSKTTSEYFLLVLGSVFNGDNPFKLNKQEKQELLNNVLLYYKTHLDINIEFKSISVLQEIFS